MPSLAEEEVERGWRIEQDEGQRGDAETGDEAAGGTNKMDYKG